MAGSAAPGNNRSGKTGDPSQLSAASTTMSERTKILRACYGGTESMRAMEQDFLPIYERETPARYQSRLASTFALNKLREAVDAASAKPFRTIIKVDNIQDPDLPFWIEDVDLLGNHLHIFTHSFFNNAILDGQCHILVDHPDTIDLPNLQAQKEAGVRPYFKMVRQDDLIAAYAEYVGGDTQVTHCRIRQQRIERTPDFKEVVYNQILVIEKEPGTTNGVAQLWEQEAKAGGGSWTFVTEKTIPNLVEVPLATLHAGDKEAEYVTRPVFMDLAYKQIEHWISSSDQRSILSAARFPMLAVSGVQIDEQDEPNFAIGPFKVLYSPEAQGRWYYVEPSGKAIESGLKDLEMLEMHMDIMALNPVVATHRQYVPQNERDIQETRTHSVVHDLAISCQDTVERALRFMGNWQGKDFTGIRVLLNTDWDKATDRIAEVDKLIKAWEKRGITRETLLKEMKARNFLGEGFDVAREVGLMEALDQVEADLQTAGKEGASVSVPKTPVEAETDSVGGGDGGEIDFPNGQERPLRQI